MSDKQFLQFGAFRIDLALSRLERGGEVVPIPPKAFDLLLLLARQPGRVLSKSELMQALWPEVFVEEANLTQHVFTLRKALGVQPGGQPYIETVPRRGYTFTADVRVTSQKAAESEAASCAACGGRTPDGAAFCPACGTRLGGPPVPSPDTIPAPPDDGGFATVHEGERKNATVVHCGVPNAAAVAERLGAGGMHYLMRRLLEIADEEVGRYEGVISERHADGFVALFGARAMHEDDARRALLAAVNVRRRALDVWPGDTASDDRLILQMGLNTGPVVIGRLTGNRDVAYTAVGEVKQAADLLQQFAGPGVILVSETTRRALGGYAETEPLAIETPRGAVTAHRVVGLASASAMAPRASRALSPLVGRRRELAVLEDLAGQGLGAEGQVVTIVGEPGMGKSRLVHEVAQTRAAAGAARLEGRSVSYGSSMPCLPLIDLVRAQCGVGAGAGPEEFAERIGREARELGLPADAPDWLLRLAGIETGAAGPTRTPEAVKARTFEVLRLLLLRASVRRPLLVVVEDLHWIDRTSEEFLESIVERLAGARICLVTTARPGYRAPWMDRSYATQITLRPLAASDSAELVESVAGARALPRAVSDAILGKAEGNPFFLEELARAVVEHDRRPVSSPTPSRA